MSGVDLQACYLPGERVLGQPVHDEMVLLDLDGQEYFALNAIGAVVWQELQSGASVAAIIETLLERFDAPREQVTADVSALLDELLARGLLFSADSP